MLSQIVMILPLIRIKACRGYIMVIDLQFAIKFYSLLSLIISITIYFLVFKPISIPVVFPVFVGWSSIYAAHQV